MSTDNNQSIIPFSASQTIPFVVDGFTYLFTPTKPLNPVGREKRVYIGCFESKNNLECISLPRGIEFDKEYCLKTVSLSFPLEDHIRPQERHFWDFYPFEGENLREVIALNDDAQRLSKALSETNRNEFNKSSAQLGFLRCSVIEPVYSKFDINDFKMPSEKIACMIQIVAGLKQLFKHSVLAQHKIIAYRDLKFDNIVVQELPNGLKHLRLIDFPSIKVQDSKSTPSSNHTQLGFFSYSNTAPEDVLRRFNISERTDVFALGTMLAEIFKIWDFNGICNPLTLLFDCIKSLDVNDLEDCQKFYQYLDQKYKDKSITNLSWLEDMLNAHNKNAFWGQMNDICPEFYDLFRRAVSLNPSDRCSLDEFESTLVTIFTKLLEKENSFADPAIAKKTSYFLVDTLDINLHCDAYINSINQIAQISPNTNIAILTFGWRHISKYMSSDPSNLNMNPLSVVAACDFIRGLKATSRDNSFASEIKGCLFELSEYLKNQSNLNAFSGEIHIFTPEMPHKENSCCFQDLIQDDVGVNKIIYPTNSQIVQRFDKKAKIYVHSYKLVGHLEDAAWYTPIPLKAEPKTAVFDAANKNSENNSSVPPVKTDIPPSSTLIKGAGFRFYLG